MYSCIGHPHGIQERPTMEELMKIALNHFAATPAGRKNKNEAPPPQGTPTQ